MSLGEVMEVMVEKAWSSFSRSLSSGGGVLVDAMVLRAMPMRRRAEGGGRRRGRARRAEKGEGRK